MNLWLLQPTANSNAWQPWYDKSFGFIVRAENEIEARRLANSESGDESENINVWLNEHHSSCTILTDTGPSEIVMRDFRAA